MLLGQDRISHSSNNFSWLFLHGAGGYLAHIKILVNIETNILNLVLSPTNAGGRIHLSLMAF